MNLNKIKILFIVLNIIFLSGCNSKEDIIEKELQSGKRLSTIYYEINFKKSNKKKVMLIGGVHGNEISGTEYLDNLSENHKKLIKRYKNIGFLILPIANREAHKLKVRYPYYMDDLNRSFPGKQKGSETQELAFKIFNLVKNNDIDLVIDLHEWDIKSTKDSNKNAHGIISCSEELQKLTHKIKEINFNEVDIEIENQAYEGTLSYEISNLLDIPAFTLEANQSIDKKERYNFYDNLINLLIGEIINEDS